MLRQNILALSSIVDGTDVSEPLIAFKWLNAIGRLHNLTLLCLQRPGRTPTADQLPHVRVISWPEPAILGRAERFRAMIQPAWPLLAYHSTRWLKKELARGVHFDVAHQMFPNAMRHRSPFRNFNIPYVIGPLAGSLSTPDAFKAEVETGAIMARFRALDHLRLQYDPGLRATYERAGAVIGVAPYVKDVLNDLDLQRFETILELASDELAPAVRRLPQSRPLKLLHVGRVVRTKGLRDVIRALGQLSGLPEVTLTSAGDGDDLDACKREAAQLGIEKRISFRGHISQPEVHELYRTHDAFVFPSFREPTGGVFLEAMQFGLPIIAARRGGPKSIFDEDSCLFVDVETPEQLARDIAKAIERLSQDLELRSQLGLSAAARLVTLGTFADRAAEVSEIYHDLATGHSA